MTGSPVGAVIALAAFCITLPATLEARTAVETDDRRAYFTLMTSKATKCIDFKFFAPMPRPIALVVSVANDIKPVFHTFKRKSFKTVYYRARMRGHTGLIYTWETRQVRRTVAI